jgi:hypothetical protein
MARAANIFSIQPPTPRNPACTLTMATGYPLVNTLNWWPGKKVRVSPLWIERGSWDESKVFVNFSRKAFKQSPEYTDEFLRTPSTMQTSPRPS